MVKTSIQIQDGCILCHSCADVCPEIFVVKEDCQVIEGADTEFFWEWIEKASAVCPVDVIHIQE